MPSTLATWPRAHPPLVIPLPSYFGSCHCQHTCCTCFSSTASLTFVRVPLLPLACLFASIFLSAQRPDLSMPPVPSLFCFVSICFSSPFAHSLPSCYPLRPSFLPLPFIPAPMCAALHVHFAFVPHLVSTILIPSCYSACQGIDRDDFYSYSPTHPSFSPEIQPRGLVIGSFVLRLFIPLSPHFPCLGLSQRPQNLTVAGHVVAVYFALSVDHSSAETDQRAKHSLRDCQLSFKRAFCCAILLLREGTLASSID